MRYSTCKPRRSKSLPKAMHASRNGGLLSRLAFESSRLSIDALNRSF